MLPNVRRFNMLNNNEYWELLHAANERYLTISQQYLKLFRLCESRGVAFKDIRNHLMAEAKRCGLYRKDYVDANGNVGFAPKKILKEQKPAWFHQLNLFMSWISRNYTSYNDRLVETAKKSANKAEAKNKKNIKTTKVTDKEGNERVSTTVTQDSSVTSPVTEELSADQVLAIFTSNWDILRQFAEEKGALTEFSALMSKLGL